MKRFFSDRNDASKRRDIVGELEELAKEISETPDDPDRYAAQMILLDRQAQKERRRLCEAALEGEFSDDDLKEICAYFEDELSKLREFTKKLSGGGEK